MILFNIIKYTLIIPQSTLSGLQIVFAGHLFFGKESNQIYSIFFQNKKETHLQIPDEQVRPVFELHLDTLASHLAPKFNT